MVLRLGCVLTLITLPWLYIADSLFGRSATGIGILLVADAGRWQLGTLYQ